MKDFLKNDKTILCVILAIAIFLRIWLIKFSNPLSNDEYIAYSFGSFKFPFDFFDAIKTNSFAPLHSFYLSIYGSIFKNYSAMLGLSSLFANVLAIIVMYITGRTYFLKNASFQIGLCAAAICAISAFLIASSYGSGVNSFTFLLSTFVLLFSIKSYQSPSKKNSLWLLVFSVLLVLEHTIAIIFVIFNAFAIVAFAQRSKKNKDYITPIIGAFVLCLPLIPFFIRIFAHPTYLSKWWIPFNWYNLCSYFTDLFSPILNAQFNLQNITFIIFGLVPCLIALFLIVKSNIDTKRINKYLLCVFVSSFLTVVLITIAGKLGFETKHLLELYPVLILLVSSGWVQLQKNSKIALATIYVFLTLFYIVVSHIPSLNIL